jgi:large subunit ribosomal protein L30
METKKGSTKAKANSNPSGKKVQLELVKSTIGTPEWMRVIVYTLKLRKLRAKVVVGDNPAIRGMVAKVPHLVTLTEL